MGSGPADLGSNPGETTLNFVCSQIVIRKLMWVQMKTTCLHGEPTEEASADAHAARVVRVEGVHVLQEVRGDTFRSEGF